MEYFYDVVEFVDNNVLWIVAAFFIACLVEVIVFSCKKKKSGIFDTDGLFVCLATTLGVILGLYVLSCLGVGLVNYIQVQNWHFWSNYTTFLSNGGIAVFGIVFIIVMIVCMIKFDFHSFLARLIVSALVSGLATVLSVFVGFLLYVIVAVVWILLKLIWFVISGFFQSIFQFVVEYWQMSVAVLVGPGIIYGACCAFANYIHSFKNEVIHR